MDILKKTINEMPDHFTSRDFNKQAIANGYPASWIKRKGLSPFLHKYALNQGYASKTWVKKSVTKNKPPKYQIEKTENYTFESVDDIIKFIKSKGYRVMRPVGEWVEC